MTRRLLSEFLGSAILLAAIVGSGIMASRLSADAGVMLLANSLATGAALYVLIVVFGPVSGAHFNPAVSLAGAADGTIAWPAVAPYVAAQILGAVVGVMLAHAMFDLPLWQIGTRTRTGSGEWLAEAVATFGLVLTVAATRKRPEAAAPAIALYIVAAYWFTASTSFANPAVTIARSLTTSFAGIAPADAPAFILAQLAGAALGVIAARYLLGPTPQR